MKFAQKILRETIPHERKHFKALEKMTTKERKQEMSMNDIRALSMAMKKHLMANGWRELKLHEMATIRSGKVIRCVAFQCGCIGQRATIQRNRETDYNYADVNHTGHDEPIGFDNGVHGWRFSNTEGDILVRK